MRLRHLAVATAVILAAVGCSSDEPDPRPSGIRPAPSASGGRAVNACNLLTPAEIKAVFIREVTRSHSGPTRASNVCYFEFSRTDQLLLEVYTTAAEAVYDAGGTGEQLRSLAGLGERAKWLESTRSIVVYANGSTTVMHLLVFDGQPGFDVLVPKGRKLLEVVIRRV